MADARQFERDLVELVTAIIDRLHALVAHHGPARGVRIWSCELPHHPGVSCICGALVDDGDGDAAWRRERELVVIGAVLQAAAVTGPRSRRASELREVGTRAAGVLLRLLRRAEPSS